MKKKINNFKKLIEAFIKLDDKLYELIIKKRFDESRDKAKFYTKSIASYSDENKYRENQKKENSTRQKTQTSFSSNESF